MKKLIIILTALAVVNFTAPLQADTGSAAKSGSEEASGRTWVIGLGMLAAIGVMAGVIVASATSGSHVH